MSERERWIVYGAGEREKRGRGGDRGGDRGLRRRRPGTRLFFLLEEGVER